MKLTGQTVLITGGSKGIGRAICLALAREGANIVFAARDEGRIGETMEELKEMSGRVLAVRADVRYEEDVKRLILKAADEFGGLDILVNNAGVAYRKPLVETTLDEYDKIMDTNLKGIFLCIKYATPYIRNSKNGKIVNISSGAGLHGIPELSIYCASKSGVISITQSIASELEGEIKVYAICPGGVDTDMYRTLFGHKPQLKPEHIARKVLELVSPDSNVASGKIIEVYSPPIPHF
jgi:3-oxoacyl-[acyl-carrier protein] reductase